MRFFYTFAVTTAAVISLEGSAQVVTTQPSVVQTDSRDIIVTFHADRGNKGLAGLGPSDKVYAHTGVITSQSTSPSDWKYAPQWLDNSSKYEMKWTATDTWTLTIPSINEYYGITSLEEVVEKLAFVFRNANGSREGKTAEGGDIFVDVQQPGYTMTFTSNMAGTSITEGESVTFTVSTSLPSHIALYQNDSTTPFGEQSNGTSLTSTRRFNKSGLYTIRAVASHGDETIEKSIEVNVLGKSDEKTYPGDEIKMGAVRGDDGSVTFCIAAPEKRVVQIVGSWNDYSIDSSSTMYVNTVDGIPYFWITVDGLEKGHDYFYYYIVDGTYKVGDPYANLVLDPWNDKWISSEVFPNLPSYPSDKVDGNIPLAWYNSKMNEYDWKVKDFKGVEQNQLVIYELLIRDFTGTEGEASGNGTIEGVLSKLDYLKSLGVNAVELMPVMEFNGNNSWGYNPNFYFAPDKAYGTPDNYRRLIDECHSRGLAVILDVVFNQSDGLHPWYQMYPISKNPLYNGSAPHSYSVLNDWKQEHPLVEKQWNDVLAYWLTEYRVDGFRFDLVKGLGDDDSYGNTYDAATNMWGNPNEANTNCYNATRVARMKRLCDNMRKINPNAYCINENLATAKEENEMAADGEINWANINNSSCQFAMGYESDASLNRFYAPLDQRDWGSTVSYAESHDEERMAYKQSQWGVAGVKGNLETSMRRLGSVGAQMLMAPGAHMIWQFQEFGADQTTKNSGGNDTSPKKVIWSYLDNPDRNGLMQNYSELCRIRANYPEMFEKDVTTSVELSSWNARSISLTKGDKAIYLYVNPSVTSSARIPSVADMSSTGYALLSSSYNTTPSANAGGVLLDPGAYAVYGTTNLTAVEMPESDSVTVRVEGNNIIVEGAEAEDTYVYTLEGIKVAPTSLPTGIYIVYLPEGHAVKVAIR